MVTKRMAELLEKQKQEREELFKKEKLKAQKEKAKIVDILFALLADNKFKSDFLTLLQIENPKAKHLIDILSEYVEFEKNNVEEANS